MKLERKDYQSGRRRRAACRKLAGEELEGKPWWSSDKWRFIREGLLHIVKTQLLFENKKFVTRIRKQSLLLEFKIPVNISADRHATTGELQTSCQYLHDVQFS